jgi:nitric oxide reductase NorQ protein
MSFSDEQFYKIYRNALRMVTPFYIPQKNEIELFRSAYRRQMPVALKGPTGTGKTRLVEYMADEFGIPLFSVVGNDDLSANDLIGRYLFVGGETKWIDGPALAAVKTPGMFYFDETVESRKDTTVVIHSLSDHRRYISVEKLNQVFYAPPEFCMTISFNEFYTNPLKRLKPSTRQRFVFVELGWLPAGIEKKVIVHEADIDEATAGRLVKAAGKIRNMVHTGLEEGVSTRELIYAGKLMHDLSAMDALRATLIEPLADEPNMKIAIEEVLKNIFA